MPFELVIFDLDGTLLDTLEDLADSMNAVLRSHAYPTHAMASYRRFVGDGVENLVRRSLPADAVRDDLVARYVDQMREEYDLRQQRTTAPYHGVPELLRALSRLGLKTAVLSNKPDAATRRLVAALLAPHVFDAVVGARTGVPLKPDPAAALDIVEILGSDPNHTLYVGDTNTDMLTGRRAGMVTVGVTWGFRDEEELRSSGADHIIGEPLELIIVLGAGDLRPHGES